MPISDGAIESLIYYCIAADIRLKDPQYSEMQLAGVHAVLAQLDASLPK